MVSRQVFRQFPIRRVKSNGRNVRAGLYPARVDRGLRRVSCHGPRWPQNQASSWSTIYSLAHPQNVQLFLFISQKAAVSKLMGFAPYLSHELLLHLLEAPVIAVPYVGQRLPFQFRNFP